MIIIRDSKSFHAALKEGYKESYNFYSILDILKNGNSTYNLKPDLKECYKFLFHWSEKEAANIEKDLLYYDLKTVCLALKKEDKAKYYEELYYVTKINKEGLSKKDKIFNIKQVLPLKFEKSINLKYKVIDKKEFDIAIQYLLTYIELENPNQLRYLSTHIQNICKVVFASDKYGYKKLYLAHFFGVKEVFDQFEENDFIEYPKLLSRCNSTLAYQVDLLKYLEVVRDYKYLKKDNKSKCEYAYFLCTKNFIITADPKYFSLLEECYKDGYSAAFYYIARYYLQKNDLKNLVSCIKKFEKKYPKNSKQLILIADEILKKSTTKEGDGYNSYLKEPSLIAIDIFEKNSESLDDAQKDKLSKIFLNGLFVEKDVEKARLYSINKNDTKLDDKEIDFLLNKIEIINEHEKEDIQKTIESAKKGNILDLLLLLSSFKNEDVKMNPRLFYLIASKHKNDDIRFKSYLAYAYYNGIGIEKDLTKYNELIQECLEKDVPVAINLYLDNLYSEANSKESGQKYMEVIEAYASKGNLYALSKIAYEYYSGRFVEKDIQKAENIFLDIYNQGSTYGTGLLIFINIRKGDDESYEKAYQYTKTYLEKTHSKNAYSCLFSIHYESKGKYFSKEEAFNALLNCDFKYRGDFYHFNLYNAYYYGIGTEINYPKAKEHLLKAFALNSVDAKIILGNAYTLGNKHIQIAIDYDKAWSCFEDFIKENNIEKIKFYLAELYYSDPKRRNYKKSFELFLDCYENDNLSYCAFGLGRFYLNGYHVKKDVKKAIEYFLISAKTHPYKSYKLIATIYLNKIHEEDKDYKKAHEYFLMANKHGEDYSLYFYLGYINFKLDNYKKAAEYFKKSNSLAKNSGSYYYLGIMYRSGLYFEKDIKKAISMFETGLNIYENDTSCAYELCRIHFGEFSREDLNITEFLKYMPICLKDEKKAYHGLWLDYLVWYKKDYKEAYDFLNDNYDVLQNDEIYGDMLYNGFGVNINYKKAFEIYNSDRSEYSTSKLFKLGRCYYFGQGVEQDKEKAKDLIYQAAKDNYTPAVNFYNEFFK